MKRSWREIRRALADDKPRGSAMDRDAFWSDFRARARLRSQEQSVSRPSWVWMPRWAWAGACAMLMAAMTGLHFFGGVKAVAASEINSLEVVASHSAVLIMEDEPSQSTILWIVDMDTEGDGDST